MFPGLGCLLGVRYEGSARCCRRLMASQPSRRISIPIGAKMTKNIKPRMRRVLIQPNTWASPIQARYTGRRQPGHTSATPTSSPPSPQGHKGQPRPHSQGSKTPNNTAVTAPVERPKRRSSAWVGVGRGAEEACMLSRARTLFASSGPVGLERVARTWLAADSPALGSPSRCA